MAKDTKQHWRARTGTTRTSGDATVRDEHVRKNGDLFREILRMFNAKSEAGKTLMLQIQDEFDNDHDGYGLWEYLKAWAGGDPYYSTAARRANLVVPEIAVLKWFLKLRSNGSVNLKLNGRF